MAHSTTANTTEPQHIDSHRWNPSVQIPIAPQFHPTPSLRPAVSYLEAYQTPAR
jgi:hypothetical protein